MLLFVPHGLLHGPQTTLPMSQPHLAEETTTTTDAKGSVLRIKAETSAEERRVPGRAAQAPARDSLQVRHDGDAAGSGQLRDELGFAGMSLG